MGEERLRRMWHMALVPLAAAHASSLARLDDHSQSKGRRWVMFESYLEMHLQKNKAKNQKSSTLLTGSPPHIPNPIHYLHCS